VGHRPIKTFVESTCFKNFAGSFFSGRAEVHGLRMQGMQSVQTILEAFLMQHVG